MLALLVKTGGTQFFDFHVMYESMSVFFMVIDFYVSYIERDREEGELKIVFHERYECKIFMR